MLDFKKINIVDGVIKQTAGDSKKMVKGFRGAGFCEKGSQTLADTWDKNAHSIHLVAAELPLEHENPYNVREFDL